ncbi:MAG: T9SS type A sorting domain-containing protein, partial [Bacteroidetes bacterium]|nr:T9SS type A sorting domain-containing protein [Bacteroidota bacterium]
YAYMEVSSPNYPTKRAILNSPCFDLTGITSPEITFDYHMLGSPGTLDLQASTDGSTWTTIWTQTGGSAWSSATVSLNTYTNEDELRLRFNGVSGSTWQGDIAIDAIGIDGSGGGGGCTETEVDLTIVLDNYPGETTWTLKNGSGATVASGGPYSVANSTVNETFCLADDCYEFTINDSYGDGICCGYGNGSYTLTSGGSTLASGGAFGSSETSPIDIGNSCSPPCPTIDFNSYTINAYGAGQDAGSSAVQDGGATLFIQNNAWKSISYNYTVTANTVIEFDFSSTLQGEIHGIGFDSDDAISSNLTFKVHGTQNWGITNYDNYSGSGWTTYTIPVGSFYTGTFNRLVFVADHDVSPFNGNAWFRNVKIYEGSCGSSDELIEPVSNISMGNEGELNFEVYPNPFDEEISIRIPYTENQTAEINIFNATGQHVYRQENITTGNEVNIRPNLA